MGYLLESSDASVEAGLRRIAREQIGKAIGSIGKLHHAEAIHDVRKRCKKLRGLVRLVRPAFPDYRRENAAFRDIAQMISASRDAKVMQDTYDLLVEECGKEIGRRALGAIRQRFTLQRKAESRLANPAEFLDLCRVQLEEARERAESWTLNESGWDALRGGLAKTYSRACKCSEAAWANPGAAVMHELRKRVKYHWCHARLLANIYPQAMRPHIALAYRMSEMLGQHHDICVFEERIVEERATFGEGAAVDAMVALAHGRKAKIEDSLRPLAGRLLAESPEALVCRWGAYWDVWQGEIGTGNAGADG